MIVCRRRTLIWNFHAHSTVMLIRVRKPCSRDAVSVDEMSRSFSCSDDVLSKDASTPGYVDVWGVDSSIDGIDMVAMERSPLSAAKRISLLNRRGLLCPGKLYQLGTEILTTSTGNAGRTSTAGRVHGASDAEGREKGGPCGHSSSLAGPRHNRSAAAGRACAVPYCGRGTSSHLPLRCELGPVAGPRASSSKRTASNATLSLALHSFLPTKYFLVAV